MPDDLTPPAVTTYDTPWGPVSSVVYPTTPGGPITAGNTTRGQVNSASYPDPTPPDEFGGPPDEPHIVG